MVKHKLLYTFFMLIFLNYCFLIKSIYLYVLFEVVAASLNKFVQGYKVVSLSILGGCLISALKLFAFNSVLYFAICFFIITITIVVLFCPKTFFSFLQIFLTSLAYCLLKWGVCFLEEKIIFLAANVTVKSLIIYYVLDFFVTIILGFVIYVAFRVAYQKKLILDFVYDMRVTMPQGENINLKMLLDSGNSLMDDKTNLPIIVCSKDSLGESYKKLKEHTALRRVEYQTLNGYCSSMEIFLPESLTIIRDGKQKKINAMIGVVDKKFKIYDGLLHLATC